MATRRQALPDERRGWHFSRVVSVDAIINIIGIAVVLGLPLLYWGRSLESRVLTLENFNVASLNADVRRDADTREQRIAFALRLEKFSGDIEQLKIGIAQILARQTPAQPPPNGRR